MRISKASGLAPFGPDAPLVRLGQTLQPKLATTINSRHRAHNHPKAQWIVCPDAGQGGQFQYPGKVWKRALQVRDG
jgi:hypothetical protein